MHYPPNQKAGRYRVGKPVNHWEDQLAHVDDDWHFGVSQEGGYGGRSEVDTFFEDDPRALPFVEPIRQLLLRNVTKFLRRGLITPQEVQAAIDAGKTKE